MYGKIGREGSVSIIGIDIMGPVSGLGCWLSDMTGSVDREKGVCVLIILSIYAKEGKACGEVGCG